MATEPRHVSGNRIQHINRHLVRPDGNTTHNTRETVDIFADNFAMNSDDSNYSAKFREFRDSYHHKPIIESHHIDPMNKPFTSNQLRKALASCENTSPGPDDIPNAVICNLPEKAAEYLLKFITIYGTSKCS